MTKYLNKSGKSSVLGYSFTENSISILFKDKKFIYTDNERKPGVLNVKKMIQYAMAGKGLNGYIKKNIQSNYFSKTGN
jgi:acyl-CoA-binding protein